MLNMLTKTVTNIKDNLLNTVKINK